MFHEDHPSIAWIMKTINMSINMVIKNNIFIKVIVTRLFCWINQLTMLKNTDTLSLIMKHRIHNVPMRVRPRYSPRILGTAIWLWCYFTGKLQVPILCTFVLVWPSVGLLLQVRYKTIDDRYCGVTNNLTIGPVINPCERLPKSISKSEPAWVLAPPY